MKFGDYVISVATITVILALIAFPIEMMFVSALGLSLGQDVAVFVSIFLSALIGGVIFARKIWEARRETITKITVLWAALGMLMAMVIPAGVAHWGLMAEDDFRAMYPDTDTTTLSTAEWVSWEMMALDAFVFLVVAISLVLGFVGLYIGSMLRRPR